MIIIVMYRIKDFLKYMLFFVNMVNKFFIYNISCFFLKLLERFLFYFW